MGLSWEPPRSWHHKHQLEEKNERCGIVEAVLSGLFFQLVFRGRGPQVCYFINRRSPFSGNQNSYLILNYCVPSNNSAVLTSVGCQICLCNKYLEMTTCLLLSS